MTTIKDADGVFVTRGKNLAILYEKARQFGGVKKIHVQEIEGIWRARMVVTYANDYTAECLWADFEHCCDTLARRCMLRFSWWYEAEQIFINLKGERVV